MGSHEENEKERIQQLRTYAVQMSTSLIFILPFQPHKSYQQEEQSPPLAHVAVLIFDSEVSK